MENYVRSIICRIKNQPLKGFLIDSFKCFGQNATSFLDENMTLREVDQ